MGRRVSGKSKWVQHRQAGCRAGRCSQAGRRTREQTAVLLLVLTCSPSLSIRQLYGSGGLRGQGGTREVETASDAARETVAEISASRITETGTSLRAGGVVYPSLGMA